VVSFSEFQGFSWKCEQLLLPEREVPSSDCEEAKTICRCWELICQFCSFLGFLCRIFRYMCLLGTSCFSL